MTNIGAADVWKDERYAKLLQEVVIACEERRPKLALGTAVDVDDACHGRSAAAWLRFPRYPIALGTALKLDNGIKCEDSVKDIGALLDWVAPQPQLDASRVLVTGGSYGGYMTLAVATHYSDRIRAAVDIVGISNFNTFLKNTETYRRDLRRAEYGDERVPEMAAFFEHTAPLNNAERIRKPLFVIQGGNDPRVPPTESEQMVARAKGSGTPVWYMMAKDEGHGFAKKGNQDAQFYATVMFVREHLLARSGD